jgi:hypothetical protein
VLYRAAGESQWHQGVTVNLSAAGAVIEGVEPSRSAAITVVIPFPFSAGCLTGRGRVLPRPESCARGEHGRFAIVVSRYRLQRQSAVLTRLDALHQEC